MYIAITLNHIRAVKKWTDNNGGTAQLDLQSFELEVKARNRYYRLYPQFQGKINGHLAHVAGLTEDSMGFIGWLPYRPLTWPISSDKLLFKSTLRAAGLRTPDWWQPDSAGHHDYILKKSAGSFGYEIRGPYAAQRSVSADLIDNLQKQGRTGQVFAEQFVKGKIVKAWFWGGTPFHLQLYSYPEIRGDGQGTVRSMVERALKAAGLGYDTYPEMQFVHSALELQKLDMQSVLADGQKAWLDFRYGRQFGPDATQADNDNQLDSVALDVRAQLASAGAFFAQHLQEDFPAPVQYSVDGVLDDDGNVWWLEMNSNPIFPPTGYAYMLDTLFGSFDSSSPRREAAQGQGAPRTFTAPTPGLAIQ